MASREELIVLFKSPLHHKTARQVVSDCLDRLEGPSGWWEVVRRENRAASLPSDFALVRLRLTLPLQRTRVLLRLVIPLQLGAQRLVLAVVGDCAASVHVVQDRPPGAPRAGRAGPRRRKVGGALLVELLEPRVLFAREPGLGHHE